MFFQRVQIIFHRIVNAEVDDFKAGAFHHHRHQVFADVVDVAFHRADDHFADRFGAGLRQQRAQNFHPAFHRVGRHQHFRDEQNAVAKINADDAHAFHQRFVQNFGGGPAALQQNVGAFNDLFAQAVVEIIVHLFDQFVVGQRAQVQIFVGVIRARFCGFVHGCNLTGWLWMAARPDS